MWIAILVSLYSFLVSESFAVALCVYVIMACVHIAFDFIFALLFGPKAFQSREHWIDQV